MTHMTGAVALAVALIALWCLLMAADKARRAVRRWRSRRRFTRALRHTLLLADLEDAMGRTQPPPGDGDEQDRRAS